MDKTIATLVQEAKGAALAEFLGCSTEIITSSQHSSIFDVWCREYLVVTEYEAAELIAKEVVEELWAFHPEWIIQRTIKKHRTPVPAPDYEIITKGLTAIQTYLTEKSNPMLKGLIEATCGMSFFINEAITHHGRGHFLAPYDEREEKQGDFYIYRMN